MKACVPRSMPLAQATKGAAPGREASFLAASRVACAGRCDENGGAWGELLEGSRRSRRRRQPNAGQLGA